MLLEQDWQPVRPPVFAQHPRLGLPAKSRRLARRTFPRKIPPARPADRLPDRFRLHSESAGSPGEPLANPAGLLGGSFGFRLHHRLSLSQNPAGSPGGSFPAKSRRLARRIIRSRRLSDYITPAQPLLKPKSRRLARRIVPRKIPPARPADHSASDYLTGSTSPRIPPACPADRSVSDYLTGSASPQNPAGLPGGSFGFRLPHRLNLSQNPAGLPGGSFGFRLPHRLGLGC